MKAIIDGKRAELAARWLEQEIEALQQVNTAALSFAEFWASYPLLKDET
jgi:hypothetical protein